MISVIDWKASDDHFPNRRKLLPLLALGGKLAGTQTDLQGPDPLGAYRCSWGSSSRVLGEMLHEAYLAYHSITFP